MPGQKAGEATDALQKPWQKIRTYMVVVQNTPPLFGSARVSRLKDL